eukprot:gnl/TRDRNA2_/TRDRNA2_185464_c0_seq1.p1 gnl/TRDRNA2_/TRDRNA2_185464_c0~~gnl/TRDRNA2_/TRDRNA2_185464_c0_seq1.p1  ORF type:complete len:736 (+),score=110.58 gnl/TRDRNA2_/TRDRNA2_185464_c0_seq1:190-2208(+)
MLLKGNPDMAEHEIRVLYRLVDKNHDGSVSFNEFVDFISDRDHARRESTEEHAARAEPMFRARAPELADLEDVSEAPSRSSTPSSTTSLEPGNPCSPCFSRDQVADMFNRMFPIAKATERPVVDLVESETNKSVPDKWASLRRVATAIAATGSMEKMAQKDSNVEVNIKDRIREKLFQHHRSLRDAFSKLSSGSNRGRAMDYDMFHHELQKLAIRKADRDELFAQLDENNTRTVTKSQLIHCLVNGRPEVILWELRCSLLVEGIGRQALEPVGNFLRQKSHFIRIAAGVDDQIGYAEAEAWRDEICDESARLLAEDSSNRDNPRSSKNFSLTKPLWLAFCVDLLEMTLLEAEKLYEMIAGEADVVNFDCMFETLRATVAPDITLECFVIRALASYGSFKKAFSTFVGASRDQQLCSPKSMPQTMGWKDFELLAASLEVNDRNTERLWHKLCSGLAGQGTGPWSDAKDSSFQITQVDFANCMSIWMPPTTMVALKTQLLERFGGLSQGGRALVDLGLPMAAPLTPHAIDKVMQDLHFVLCDGKKLLYDVLAYKNTSGNGGSAAATGRVLLADLLEAMHGKPFEEVHSTKRKKRRQSQDDTCAASRRGSRTRLGCKDLSLPDLHTRRPSKSTGYGGSAAASRHPAPAPGGNRLSLPAVMGATQGSGSRRPSRGR